MGPRTSQVKVELVGKALSYKNPLVSREDIHSIVEKRMQEAIDKLNDRAADIAEQTVVAALEIFDVDCNKAFTKTALRSALNELLASILDDSSKIRESFGAAIIQVATALKSLAIIASAGAKDAAAMAPFARYAAKISKQEANESVKNLGFTQPSRPPSDWNSSSDEPCTSRKDRRSDKKSILCKSSVFSSDKGMWP